MSDYHMTPTELDDTDLELLLDIEVLDSKIEATAARQRGKNGKGKGNKPRPFSGAKKTIDQIMNF